MASRFLLLAALLFTLVHCKGKGSSGSGSAGTLNTGLTISSVEFYPVQLPSGGSVFQYQLDVNTGSIWTRGGALVYQSTYADRNAFSLLLINTIYADEVQVYQLQHPGSPPPPICGVKGPDYAILHTSQGDYHLQATGCNRQEIYSLSTYQPTGLSNYFNGLSNEIAAYLARQ